MLPVEFKKYFWDCKFDELKWETYKIYITERLLNFGDMKAVDWIKSNLSDKEILNIVNTSKSIDAKTKNYWNFILSS
jgi:hypothetical protein